ncbi:molybdate ABC transporter substrate-binding protein [Anaerocolumna xylanovorans]|uniref:Molybdate-binding protein ModA n=1 Tax=Anaerocolumna xylanovorans DSM 12503 TaxID=1121345 RepID=A0A1M7YHQ9_9FIRM|nr:molybdate ABC transporter substrate-binding protein [Anaerocolumna xylanovorans]SHO52170.1 molybdenum ABC transporter, molybdate-binding protein [Anaerocolumna xylanovorans DSM 12503]
MKENVMKRVLVVILAGIMLFTTACKKADTQPAADEGIISFEDVNTDKVNLIALGNSDVPVGQYSQEIFENLSLWEGIQSKISFGANVKEVLSQVEEASVDCGVVYATDAATATDIKVVCEAPEGSLKTPVVYPVAMLSETKYPDAAKTFLNYLMTETALSEFTKVGFTVAIDTPATETEYTGKTCTLNVFAAASLTEALQTIQTAFEAKYPDIRLVFSFDSSGTLQTQIESGAEADIFFSAAAKQMSALSKEGYIADDTKADLLENKVVLIVPARQ